MPRERPVFQNAPRRHLREQGLIAAMARRPGRLPGAVLFRIRAARHRTAARDPLGSQKEFLKIDRSPESIP
jgi:hypothetical protein